MKHDKNQLPNISKARLTDNLFLLIFDDNIVKNEYGINYREIA